ncbi:MAG: hypothetical protein BGP09_02205 [Rhizobium sp. 60-20]|jgi:hypothetical protein|nr:MAG: hypothetical protein BGP09_02205 [Rhizobium sp. 60-20]
MAFKILTIALLCIAVIILAALYLMFQQPRQSYRVSSPSPLSREAAVGRVVINAAQRDPALAALMRSALQAAPEEDRALAADLIVALPKQ